MRARPTFRPPLTVLLVLLLLFATALAPGPTEVLAANGDVAKQVAILEQHAKEPFEQRQREKAIRALGGIGGADAAAALLPIFDDPYEHLADHAVSAWIQMLRGDLAAATDDFLVHRALTDRRPAVRRGAAVALGFSREKGLPGVLAKVVSREKDPLVLVALSEAAVKRKDQADFSGIFGKRLNSKSGEALYAVALAIGELDGPAAREALVDLLDHRMRKAGAGAVTALQKLDALPAEKIDAILADPAAEAPIALAGTLHLRTTVLPVPGRGLEALTALLAHPSWRVRAAAVQGALQIWQNGVVSILIDRLALEEGRLVDDLRSALQTYTGQGLGDDPDLWREWWKGKETVFKPGPRPKPLRSGRIAFGSGGDPATEDRSVAFFGLPLRSTRIAFVFDLSGSMREPAEKGDPSKSRLDLLKEKFAATARRLPEGTVFDLFVLRYPSDHPPKPRLTRAFKKLRPAGRKSVAQAIEWLGKQEAKGWGAFYEPLTAALETEADTIVLLSDGSPSRGILDRDFRILMEFPKANRFRQVAVSTVLIGTNGADRDFMRDLSAETGGRFSQVR